MNEEFCDIKTGICEPSNINELYQIGTEVGTSKIELIYIGDPMCSWCWGISPSLIKLRDHFAKEGLPYKTLVGGLRPGGGDPWNSEMKSFLRHHWDQVNDRSGQPFGYKLFEYENFNYDTEPSCRAVVTARHLLNVSEMELFEEIQRKFYVDSEDPTQVNFYKSICQKFDVDFHKFEKFFNSDETKQETNREFILSRNWGIQSYPAVILRSENKLTYIAQGFSTFEDMKSNVSKSIMGT